MNTIAVTLVGVYIYIYIYTCSLININKKITIKPIKI